MWNNHLLNLLVLNGTECFTEERFVRCLIV